MAWEVKKDDKRYNFCFVSGGYVMYGTREKTNPLNNTSDSCYVEEYASNTQVQNILKSEFGDKIYKEVSEKVQKIVAERNKKTSSPQI
eukprot:TRINITY_DN2200_c0_g1_i1.p1 TRINITY_DN2200_c0_g1~~TRINITY_DN2200_c0_g1_i1.p1  ORF type:complete len:88 (-),score=11.30 TRINITY_DN2200_c0_g1_i1:92-355(-)